MCMENGAIRTEGNAMWLNRPINQKKNGLYASENWGATFGGSRER
jgi:hypothetical protein